MRILTIGGTRFSGRLFSETALAAGHELTLFHRGRTGAELFPEARRIAGDRMTDVSALVGQRYDAVVDFCGTAPRGVAATASALAGSGLYVYISSISAHVASLPPGADADAPTHPPAGDEVEEVTEKTYGPMKAGCEAHVRRVFGERAAIVRPGFVVGRYDPTDRLPSLLRRAAGGGRMLLPGPPDQALQFVDARDLAAFLLAVAERGEGGVYDAVHPRGTASLAGVVEAARDVAGADTAFVWAEPRWLSEQLGDEAEDAFPMWSADDTSFHELSGAAAARAGLRSRPLVDTVRDTLAWDRSPDRPPRPSHGLAPEREAELLAAWERRAP